MPFDETSRTLLAWWKNVRIFHFMAGDYAVTTRTLQSYCTEGNPYMTSDERHEARYQRRKAERERRIRARSEALGTFEEVFSFRHLYLSGKKCCKNVMWKNSTQRFMGTLLLETYNLHEQLMAGAFTGKGFIHFTIMERGKLRHIRSVHITERAVQKNLCDYFLVPCYAPAFVYDNGASLKGKGMDFSLQRMVYHLQRHYRQHGRKGGILFYDFSGYFDSAPHGPLYSEAERRIVDLKIRALTNQFMEAFGPIGLGLGSQISQTDALMLPNPLDHMSKEQLGIEGYGRYMDDGYLIHEDMAYLKECRGRLIAKCKELGIALNEKKTRIIPLTDSFVYLKTRFQLTETGAVILKMSKRSTTSIRRKLPIFKKWLDDPERPFGIGDVRSSYESYHGQMKRGNSFKTVQRTDHYFKDIFGFYPNQKGWEQHGTNYQRLHGAGNSDQPYLGETARERLLRSLD